MLSFEEFLTEADLLNQIGKEDKLGLDAGMRKHPDVSAQEYQDRNSYDYHDPTTRKISTLKGLDVYHSVLKGKPNRYGVYAPDSHHYYLHDPKTNIIHIHVKGHKDNNKVLQVDTLASSGQSPVKAQDFYHHLLKNHVKALVGSSHTIGGQKVWNRLANKKTVSIHGWLNGKPVPMDARNPDETHSDWNEQRKHEDDAGKHYIAKHGDPYSGLESTFVQRFIKYMNAKIRAGKEFEDQRNTKLVASYHPLKKMKAAALRESKENT